jgi:DNA-binding XRE family transcriptional regulator
MAVMTKTPGGEEIVILSRQEFDELAADSEDLADIRRANEIMAGVADGTEEYLTSEEVDEFLAAKTPLAFWRKKRGLTQAALATQAGVAETLLSEIEEGEAFGDAGTLKAIATALRLTLEDLTLDEPAT